MKASPDESLAEVDVVTGRPLDTPVLLIIFNRLDTTVPVFEAIRRAAPPRLYVAADGPREDRPGEDLMCEVVRRHVVEGVDWDCEVRTLFRDRNLGCKRAVSEAITWFFDHEEMGIVLEDDCLPDQSFFWFCEELLERYADDDRVMHISGICLVRDVESKDSYFFSIYPRIWGWATWRSAWNEYSLTTDDFEDEYQTISGQFASHEERVYWRKMLGQFYAGKIDTWDYPWVFTIWKQGGLSVCPTRNIVKNIGFTSEASHTKGWKDYRGWADLELKSLDVVRHPGKVEINQDLDHRMFQESFRKPLLVLRGLKVLKRQAVKRYGSVRNRSRTAAK